MHDVAEAREVLAEEDGFVAGTGHHFLEGLLRGEQAFLQLGVFHRAGDGFGTGLFETCVNLGERGGGLGLRGGGGGPLARGGVRGGLLHRGFCAAGIEGDGGVAEGFAEQGIDGRGAFGDAGDGGLREAGEGGDLGLPQAGGFEGEGRGGWRGRGGVGGGFVAQRGLAVGEHFHEGRHVREFPVLAEAHVLFENLVEAANGALLRGAGLGEAGAFALGVVLGGNALKDADGADHLGVGEHGDGEAEIARGGNEVARDAAGGQAELLLLFRLVAHGVGEGGEIFLIVEAQAGGGIELLNPAGGLAHAVLLARDEPREVGLGLEDLFVEHLKHGALAADEQRAGVARGPSLALGGIGVAGAQGEFDAVAFDRAERGDAEGMIELPLAGEIRLRPVRHDLPAVVGGRRVGAGLGGDAKFAGEEAGLDEAEVVGRGELEAQLAAELDLGLFVGTGERGLRRLVGEGAQVVSQTRAGRLLAALGADLVAGDIFESDLAAELGGAEAAQFDGARGGRGVRCGFWCGIFRGGFFRRVSFG